MTRDGGRASVPLARPRFGAAELAAVGEALDSGWVAGQGPRGSLLEQAIAQRTGRAHAVAVNNCTSGLTLALGALGVGPGDEVIVPDYTFPATALAVLHCGANVVLADVDAATSCVDAGQVASRITPRTKAIIGVDSLGLPADWSALEELAAVHGLALVEDAACSLGATYQGRPAGSFGRVAVFSLHARKGITCGEGGVVVTDDPNLADTMRSRAAFGISSPYARQSQAGFRVPEFVEPGWNFKLSDILAAIALVQLDGLDESLELRSHAAQRYAALLGEVDGLAVPEVPADRSHAWQSYAVLLDPGVERDAVATDLISAGVGANIGTYSLSAQPLFAGRDIQPVSRDFFRRHLALPMFAGITEADQSVVSRALKDVLRKALGRTS